MPLVKEPRQRLYVQRPPPLLGASGRRKLIGSILMIVGSIFAIAGSAVILNEYFNLDLSYVNGQLNVNARTVLPSSLAILVGPWLFRVGLILVLAPSDDKAMKALKRLGF